MRLKVTFQISVFKDTFIVTLRVWWGSGLRIRASIVAEPVVTLSDHNWFLIAARSSLEIQRAHGENMISLNSLNIRGASSNKRGLQKNCVDLIQYLIVFAMRNWEGFRKDMRRIRWKITKHFLPAPPCLCTGCHTSSLMAIISSTLSGVKLNSELISLQPCSYILQQNIYPLESDSEFRYASFGLRWSRPQTQTEDSPRI